MAARQFDKSKWGDGPWLAEPDRVEFMHAGLRCLMQRYHMGSWCGYVGVPPGHVLHGNTRYDDLPVNVHGGLTYADACHGDICHDPENTGGVFFSGFGCTHDVFWFGFDCAHAWDAIPEMSKDSLFSGDVVVYRDEQYVRQQVESLAKQLAALATVKNMEGDAP